jgi:sugar phosphate isomerase/epimerase
VDGLEVMVYPDWISDLASVAAAFRSSGLNFPVIHAVKGIGTALGSTDRDERTKGLGLLSANCAFGEEIGADLLVLHLWDLPSSDQNLELNLEALESCTELAVGSGLRLAVETIPCARADPLTNIKRVFERDPRSLAALDTEFLMQHQQLDLALASDWLWTQGRVGHIHIKDYDGQPRAVDGYRRYLLPGEGAIDFHRFFRLLGERGFNGTVSLEASVVERDGAVELAGLLVGIADMTQLIEEFLYSQPSVTPDGEPP